MDTPVEAIEDLTDNLQRDVDVIRPSILRKMEEFVAPCEKGPCQFGELINPDDDRRAWQKKILKSLNMKRKDNERLT